MSAALAAIQKNQASASPSSLLVTVTIASQLQVSNLIMQVSMVSVWGFKTPPWEAFVCRKYY